MAWFKRSPSAVPDAPKPARRKRGFVRDWVVPLACVGAVMTVVRASVADWNDVPTGSMKPTILEGDRIFVNKLAFGLRVPLTRAWLCRWDAPRRGDIVTFASPVDGLRLVKRVVGVPGDRVSMHANRLVVNGEEAELDLLNDHATDQFPGGPRVRVELRRERVGGMDHTIATIPGLASVSEFAEVVVPEGSYFVMGDNRDLSNDSRFIGCVPLGSVYGRSPAVALSVDVRGGWSPRWERWLMALK